MNDNEESRLRVELDGLRARERDVTDRLGVLAMEAARARFTCPCVRLNSDIGIHTSSTQFYGGRRGLTFGLVGDTLSADATCPACAGTGVPPEKKKPRR